MPLPNVPNNLIPWPQRPSGHVFAGDLNGQLRDTVRFLSNRPVYYGVQSFAGQSITSGGPGQDVQLDAGLIDNYAGQTSVTKYTIQQPGVYLAMGGISYISASTSNFGAQFDVNGSISARGSLIPGANLNVTPLSVDLLNLASGATVALSAFQNTGGAVTLSNTTTRQPYLYLVWVGNQVVPGIPTLVPPAPRTWSINDLCTDFAANAVGQGSFNVEIFNNLSFLVYPPFCRAINPSGTGQGGIVTATDTHITGLSTTTTGAFDNWAAYSGITDTWTAPISGVYFIAAQVGWTNAAAASYVTEVKVNASSVITTYNLASVGGQNNTILCGHKYLRLTAGDTIQLFGRQNSGGNLSTTTNAGDLRLITLWTGE